MNNPFALIDARLANIETILLDIKHPPITLQEKDSDRWLDLNDLIEYDPEKRKKATWYSKISKGEVPYHKKGKKVYFLKSEIDNWLKEGKCKSRQEIDDEAEAYFNNMKRGLKNAK